MANKKSIKKEVKFFDKVKMFIKNIWDKFMNGSLLIDLVCLLTMIFISMATQYSGIIFITAIYSFVLIYKVLKKQL